jgi:hypothetical protein
MANDPMKALAHLDEALSTLDSSLTKEIQEARELSAEISLASGRLGPAAEAIFAPPFMRNLEQLRDVNTSLVAGIDML